MMIPGILCVLLTMIGVSDGATLTERKQLVEVLLADYNPGLLPLNTSDSPVDVTVEFSLLNVEETHDAAEIFGEFRFTWMDVSLIWDPVDYGDLLYIVLPQQKIWSPDISVSNSESGMTLKGSGGQMVEVTHEGRVNWKLRQPVRVSCAADAEFFPFDTKTCNITLQSFVHSVQDMNMGVSRSDVILDSLTPSTQWEIKSTYASSQISPTSSATFTFELARYSSHYVLGLILPLLLLALVNTTVFLFPPNSGEKVIFASVLLLAFLIFVFYLQQRVPASGDIPILIIYSYFHLALSALAVILSVMVVRWADKMDSRRVPDWAERCGRVLRTFFCWNDRGKQKWMFPAWRNHHIVNHWSHTRSWTLADDTDDEQRLDWLEVAEVVDRLLYVIFLTVTLLAAIICLSLMVNRW